MRSKHQREVQELKEQLHRAHVSSERDQALREKVFNEAKAEVIALNKKVWPRDQPLRRSSAVLPLLPSSSDHMAASVTNKSIFLSTLVIFCSFLQLSCCVLSQLY